MIFTLKKANIIVYLLELSNIMFWLAKEQRQNPSRSSENDAALQIIETLQSIYCPEPDVNGAPI